VDVIDLLLLIGYLRDGGETPGDFNVDEKTDYRDLFMFTKAWHIPQP